MDYGHYGLVPKAVVPMFAAEEGMDAPGGRGDLNKGDGGKWVGTASWQRSKLAPSGVRLMTAEGELEMGTMEWELDENTWHTQNLLVRL